MNDTAGIREDGFDYKIIKEDLKTVLLSTSNKLEREWPSRYTHIDSARELLLVNVKTALNTFDTIVYICADEPEDFRRLRSFCLSVPPMNRTILEGVMTIVFVLEDLSKHSEWFYKSGYRELIEKLDRYRKNYNDKPEWRTFIENLVSFLRLTKQEIAEPKRTIQRWPNPGRMPRLLRENGPGTRNASYIEYLNDLYYGPLSGQSHLSNNGLLDRGGFYLPREIWEQNFGDRAEVVMDQALVRFRNDQIWTAVILTLALASEIELHFGFGLAEKLKYLWALIANYSDYSKDLYERRYSDL